MPGRFLEAGGVRTYYEEYGEGRPLVMLHGDLWNIECFSEQVRELSKKLRLILPERRGHGRTPDAPGVWSYPLFASDTAAFMDALGLHSAYLLGHSGGANIALEVAVARPDLVEALVLISGDKEIKLTEEQRRTALSRTVDDFRRRAPFIAESVERVTPDGKRRLPKIYEKTKELYADWCVPPERLATLNVRALLMVGDRDFVPVEEYSSMAKMIPGAQLCVVPGADHGLMRRRAGLVNTILLDFEKSA
ncbi:MAG: alpha/beta hydrolase [Nitrososphaerota archaeon]|nr:alpha/beta hydrolase [Nitrososphaerota archaeon]